MCMIESYHLVVVECDVGDVNSHGMERLLDLEPEIKHSKQVICEYECKGEVEGERG